MKVLQHIFHTHAPSAELPSLLEDPEDFHRRRVLAMYMMSLFNSRLARLSRRSEPFPCRSVPATVMFTFSLLVTSISLGSLVLFRYNTPRSAWVHLYLGVQIFLILWTPERLMRKVFKILLLPGGQPIHSRHFWECLATRHTYQVLLGVSGALLSAVIGQWLFQIIFGELPGLPLYGMLALLGFILGVGVCGMLVGAINFAKHITIEQFHLYAFDPHKSPIIDHLSDIYETSLWLFGIILVVGLLPLMFLQQPQLVLFEMAVSIGGIGLLFGQFLFAQIRLSELVRRRKEQVIEELQRRIETFYSSAERLDKTAFEDLQNLMKLHDQVVASSGWGISTTRLSRYLRTFALPTLAAAYTNRDALLQTYQWLLHYWP